MNTPDAPLTPETLDELLSADLDGEFERAAAELGFTVDDARDALDAAPATPQRRAELIRARELLAAPVSVAPSVTARLVAAALDGSVDELRAGRQRRTRSWRRLVTVAAAAAVAAGVVALVATNRHAGRSSTVASGALPKTAEPSARRAAPRRSGHSVDFGDVSSPATLRAVVEMRLGIATATAAPTNDASAANGTDVKGLIANLGALSVADVQGPLGVQGPQSVPGVHGLPAAQGLQGVQGLQGDEGIQGPVGATGPTGPTGPIGAAGATGPVGAVGGTGAAGIGAQGPSGNQPNRFGSTAPLSSPQRGRKVADRVAASAGGAGSTEAACDATIEQRAHLRAPAVLSGIGTDAHRPVVIAVFAHGHGYVAYVLAASDCAVVTQQTLP
jgi:hypothetical protein